MARPWYTFYPGDYARDTGHLSMVEDGAYRRLMDHYYSTGEPLPTDVERLLRLCRANDPTEQAAVRYVLDEFFVLGDDGYHHLRIDTELVKSAEKAEKCARAGRLSASKRQQASEHNGNKNSTDVITDVGTDVPTDRQPPQPHPHPQPIKEINSSFVGGGAGARGSGRVTIQNPDERIARFQRSLANAIGREGWQIVAAAADPSSDEHERCLEICKATAKKIGKGWPHHWPAVAA